MSKLKSYLLVLTALLAILVLLGVQVYWLLYSYKIEEALFSKSVRVALNQSIATLSKNEGMCQSMQSCFSCDSSFKASQQKTPHVLQNLDRQIRNDLSRYDIDLAYELAIFKGKDTLKLNNLDQIAGSACYRLSLDKVLQSSDTEIGVIFPSRYNFFLHRMGLMFLGSVLLILMITFIFSLVISYYLKEVTLSKSIKEMVNNLAHEFRTPLSSISLAANMIRQAEEASSNAKIRKYTDTILEENRRLQRQSDHILQLAALEQNNLFFQFREIELTEIIEEALKSVWFLVEQRGGIISKSYGAKVYPIYGDHNELVHVFMNLLVNACKYSPKKLEINLSIQSSHKGTEVTIEDKGVGIAGSEKKKIFEKYYRISSGNQHNTNGFGIGLYYVKEILKAHHASISVESEPGKGSLFCVFFPNDLKKNGEKD